MEHRPFDHDKLSFLSRHFALDVAMAVQLCIDYLEEAITAQPIGKPKKSLLNVAAIDNERYLFSFEGIGVLGTLQFRGFIEPIDKSNTSIKGFVRLSDRAFLKNALMILITLLFIRLPYISIAFLLITVSSLYFDIRLLRNAVNVLEKVFEPV